MSELSAEERAKSEDRHGLFNEARSVIGRLYESAVEAARERDEAQAEAARLREALPKAIRSAKIEGYALSLHADKHHQPRCKFCTEFWDKIMEQGYAALGPDA